MSKNTKFNTFKSNDLLLTENVLGNSPISFLTTWENPGKLKKILYRGGGGAMILLGGGIVFVEYNTIVFIPW